MKRIVRQKFTVSIPLGISCVDGKYQCPFYSYASSLDTIKELGEIAECNCGYYKEHWISPRSKPLKSFKCYWEMVLSQHERYR